MWPVNGTKPHRKWAHIDPKMVPSRPGEVHRIDQKLWSPDHRRTPREQPTPGTLNLGWPTRMARVTAEEKASEKEDDLKTKYDEESSRIFVNSVQRIFLENLCNLQNVYIRFHKY